MRRFLFSVRPEIDELPIQQKVNLLVLYVVVLASLAVLPFTLSNDIKTGALVAVFFEGLYLAFVLSGMVIFFLTRSVRHARILVGIGIFLLAAFLIVDAGGSRGTGLFYFVSAFSLLYFVLGFQGGILFAVFFFGGVLVRFLEFPLPAASLFNDLDLQIKFLVVFGVASSLGILAIVYQHLLVRHLSLIAYRDSVTGLSNRNQLAEHLELTVRDGRPFALMAVKLFHFDDLSTHRGMVVGDSTLEAVGERIHNRCRLIPEAMAGRWSGTLFLIRLPGLELSSAEHLGRSLVNELSQPFSLKSSTVFVHPAVAITRFPEDGETIDRLVANLTMTLGHSDDHVGQVRLFNEEAWTAEQRRFRVAASLKGALERNEFCLVYQPKIRLADRTPYGAEVLLRWTNPDLGPVTPAEFIPIAEAEGLIHDITWFVIDRFLDDLPAIEKARGSLPSPGPHAVNLSPIDLSYSQLPELLTERLTRRGLGPEILELEITEGVMMSGDPHVKAVLKELKALGFRLAIDDFGTGYSSLSYLHRFEADGLKIDQSFIKHLGTVSTMPPIVDAVISLGLALDMGITAEGVETETQADYLVRRGCQWAQGWLFSKALPLDAYLDWLEHRSPS